jgi:plastocyanin
VRLAILMLLGLSGSAFADEGSVEGTVTSDGKWTAIWVEGVPAGTWSVPKEKPQITQHGARFQPEFLIIPVGQTVVMPNDDRITHNVFSVSPAKKFDLGHYPQGESRSVKFDKPGVIDLFCDIHDNMHAVVVVAPSMFFATVTGNEGKFNIHGVPAGAYKLSAYSSSGATTTTSVVVGPGAPVAVKLILKKS